MAIPRTYGSSLVVFALLSAFSAVLSIAQERESYEQTIPFTVGGDFLIENVNGSITIETWNEGSVRIEAEKVADSVEALAGD